MFRILILNGPNLDLLGTREPHIYGNRSFEDFLNEVRTAYPGIAFSYAQSNVEGELVARMRAAPQDQDAIILNAAGYSHTSVALRDTIAVLNLSLIHI